MTTQGIEAIKLYIPPADTAELNLHPELIEELQGQVIQSNDSNMSSVDRYRSEWSQLINTLKINPEIITELAYAGDLKISKFRSVYWALLLRVLCCDSSSWREQRIQQRLRYDKLKQEFMKNPHEIQQSDDDPLSQSTQSVWNQYFSDQELFAIIRQDVVRTFPGVDFFRKAIIQNAMCNILFYYARAHPYIGYRQGMHEILAPILFVTYGDHQSLLHFMEIEKSQIDETLSVVLDPKFLEPDTYSLFSRIMSSIEAYYRVANLTSSPSGICSLDTQQQQPNAEIEVIGQLNSIREKILAKEDLHLHNYLLKLDIPLHIFGIRWLRLLFGREFPLLDLLVLWDAIFADGDRFDLPNYILVSMLIHIRDKLLLSDYTTCLTYLMRYPNNVDINLILRHALHMQMPKRFERPANAFVYFTVSTESFNRLNAADFQPSNPKKNLVRAPNGTYFNEQENKNTSKAQNLRECSSSVTDNVKVEEQINMLQARNAATLAAEARLRLPVNETDRIIMDGYSENSPELLKLELKNAQTVITITRNKLQSYSAILNKHLSAPRKYSDELAQTLDGINELCALLHMFPNHNKRTPIDQALEADEQAKLLTKDIYPMFTALPRPRVENTQPTEQTTTPLSPQPLNDKEISSSKSRNEKNNGAHTKFRSYERPDNDFAFHSARLFGNQKEIELQQITIDEKIVPIKVVPTSSSSKGEVPTL